MPCILTVRALTSSAPSSGLAAETVIPHGDDELRPLFSISESTSEQLMMRRMVGVLQSTSPASNQGDFCDSQRQQKVAPPPPDNYHDLDLDHVQNDRN
ncbi:unnamed protein product [Heligmosomoides polygyrus]|uniref:Secreted protein n=1 Tax=Heligmosomoides polygyrus TaxID=6339 RepID=A0A183FMH8_HELPZ|nr:unnamed protein product [Heligmosomoides polygyrus]